MLRAYKPHFGISLEIGCKNSGFHKKEQERVPTGGFARSSALDYITLERIQLQRYLWFSKGIQSIIFGKAILTCDIPNDLEVKSVEISQNHKNILWPKLNFLEQNILLKNGRFVDLWHVFRQKSGAHFWYKSTFLYSHENPKYTEKLKNFHSMLSKVYFRGNQTNTEFTKGFSIFIDILLKIVCHRSTKWPILSKI